MFTCRRVGNGNEYLDPMTLLTYG